LVREYREFMNQQQHARGVRIAIFGGTILVLSVCVALVTRILLRPMSGSTPAAPLPATAAPTATPTALTPMPTDTPALVNTSAPTDIPVLTETPPSTPSPELFPASSLDPQGDVEIYEGGDWTGEAPGGVDIRATSVGADLRVALQPVEEVSAELPGLAAEGDILLWISFYDPAPGPPTVFADWVFALDVDGDVATGRPAGTVRVNPDLGYEVAIGVSYNDASGEYETYFLVWDPASQALILQSDEPRVALNEARTLIGLALPLETLASSVAQTSGVTLAAGEVRGRAAAQSYVGERKVIDFCPDRPD
jgi:hypothetical protein